MKSVQPLIMCGGSGTRLWPLSRDTLPKQFAPLLGPRSTFQNTLLRVKGRPFAERPLIVAYAAYRFLIEDQLAEIGIEADLLLEPSRRDSGPAIVAGCSLIAEKQPDAHVLVLAADQVIRDVEAFHTAVERGCGPADSGHLVTFGITPTCPATAYGYIQCGSSLDNGTFSVARFVEKPDPVAAARYVLDGYLWNSGNFLFRADALLSEYKMRSPATVEVVSHAIANGSRADGTLLMAAGPFGSAEAQAIDYAVMEHTEKAVVVPLSCGWSDVGTWDALWAVSEHDADGNVRRGDVEIIDSQDCYVSSDGRLASLLGVRDLVVVAERDAILVADRARSSDVKRMLDALRRTGRSEATSHAQVRRPWGWYEVLGRGSSHQVKHILVRPGGRLSLQSHRHRAEHWVVVRGHPLVTVGEEMRQLAPLDHVFVPLGAVHRLENFGQEPVEIIEVQYGDYLGEDDIIRLEDIYDRV